MSSSKAKAKAKVKGKDQSRIGVAKEQSSPSPVRNRVGIGSGSKNNRSPAPLSLSYTSSSAVHRNGMGEGEGLRDTTIDNPLFLCLPGGLLLEVNDEHSHKSERIPFDVLAVVRTSKRQDDSTPLELRCYAPHTGGQRLLKHWELGSIVSEWNPARSSMSSEDSLDILEQDIADPYSEHRVVATIRLHHKHGSNREAAEKWRSLRRQWERMGNEMAREKMIIPSHDDVIRKIGVLSKSNVGSGVRREASPKGRKGTSVPPPRKPVTVSNTSSRRGNLLVSAAKQVQSSGTPQHARRRPIFFPPPAIEAADNPGLSSRSVNVQSVEEQQRRRAEAWKMDKTAVQQNLETLKRKEQQERERIRQSIFQQNTYSRGRSSRPATFTSTSTSPLSSWLRPSSSSSSYPSSYSPWRRPAGEWMGFTNVGNSCYMNAILQALLGLPDFVQVENTQQKQGENEEP